jgi:hypothetical protein
MADNETDGTISRGEALHELGHSGLPGATPREGFLYQDFLPQLRGVQGAKKYREMADNDPIIGASLFAFTMLLRNVQWTIDPKDDTPEAVEAKEWLESVLFQDMMYPFGDLVAEALSMLEYGFAPMEVVYKVRRGPKRDPRQSSAFTDGTLGVGKIALRSQETVHQWHFDEAGELLGLEQFVLGRPNALIPRDKLLNFTTSPRLRSPEGRSILRNAYITYLRKNTIEEAEGRAAVRAAGIVVARIPGKYLESGLSGPELAIGNMWRQMADRVAADRMGSVVIPSDVHHETKTPLYDLGFVVADNKKPADLSPIVDRYDRRMLSSMMTDFIMLGQEAVGSFALSSDKTDLFAKAGGAFLGVIGDQINRHLVGRLWKFNNFDEKLRPTLKPGDFQAPNLEALGAFITSIAGAGAQLFPDPKLEQHLKSVANLPHTVTQG